MDVIILLYIALLLVVAKFFGEIVNKIGISSLVGEVFAGILLGPILGVVVLPNDINAQLAPFVGLGMLFLLFLSGLSTRFEDMKGDLYVGGIITVIGGVLTAVAGFLFGLFFFNDIMISVFIAVALISSSTVVAVRSLENIGEQNSYIGKRVLAIMLIDDVMAMTALAIMMMYVSSGKIFMFDIFKLILVIAGFIGVVLALGPKVSDKIFSRLHKFEDDEIIFSIALVFLLIIASISGMLGLATVTGAFLAGVILNNIQYVNELVPKIKTIGYGFFIPLFFAYIGLALKLDAILSSIFIVLLLAVITILTKFSAGAFFSKYLGIKKHERMIIGASMIPRADYSLVIANVALSIGMITANIYSIVVAVVLITIVITPVIMKEVKWMR